jgi:hypothetical protein
MKIIEVEQNGRIEKYCNFQWVNNKFNSRLFDDVAEVYPTAVKEVTETDGPAWGHGWYKKNDDGMLKLHKENWDTSG